jgi:hypothetical protein
LRLCGKKGFPVKFLITVHRWLGIILCLFFSLWFFSGAVLIYVPFPSLSTGERLAAFQKDVTPSQIHISPKKALRISNIGKLDRIRLIKLEGHTVYVLHSSDNRIKVVEAEDGKPISSVKYDVALQVANQFKDHPIGGSKFPIAYDQWIVYESFDPYRPFYRVQLYDSESTTLYISERTGETLQKTTAFQRGWNYVGAVTHWIYPTILRRHWALWDQTVWWLSLFGIIAASSGLWLGVIRYREAKRKRQSVSSYQGWMRWHHILGLLVGGFVLTWIFSGWLSMDHQRLFSSPKPTKDQIEKFQGIPLARAIESISTEALRSLKPFRELEFKVINGRPILWVKEKSDSRLMTQDKSGKLSETKLTQEELINAVQKAWPEAKIKTAHKVAADDVYNQLREGAMPPNTLRVVLDSNSETWVHVDMDTGRIVSVMDQCRRVYRWLFNGLHSLDFPGLANHRPLWDAVILFLLTVGFIFSLTGVIIGVKQFREPMK